MEPIQQVQVNNYRKDLSLLHFDNGPRVQEMQQVKDQQSCISVIAAYPTIPVPPDFLLSILKLVSHILDIR